MRKVSMATRAELILAIRGRYASAGRPEKAKILDEFVNPENSSKRWPSFREHFKMTQGLYLSLDERWGSGHRRSPRPLLSQGSRRRCCQCHPLRRRLQLPPHSRMAEDSFAPIPEGAIAALWNLAAPQIGFLTADKIFDGGQA